eukprot:TRINITY_DN3250_c0_g1_i1.p1 TRINITY_DN3250_c0_g1~~TRINITY_DN3250_c0_g1_i1.p1  ORF type:complete len:160 (-),score=22.39 TRINITY_DN3250_c0_g1_i1:62-541(-)
MNPDTTAEVDRDRTKKLAISGLEAYFAAVSLSGIKKEEKLDAIADVFTPTCTLLASGNEYNGHEGVRSFYSSSNSPVMRENFKPTPKWETLAFLPDDTIDIVIDIQSQVVRDFFTFQDGKISKLVVTKESSPPSISTSFYVSAAVALAFLSVAYFSISK